jgi:hypothetical protein
MFEEDDPYPRSQLVSAAISSIYVIAAFLSIGPVAGLEVLAFCLVPLGCIWFPEAMGDWDGSSLMTHINASSPRPLVWVLGWVVLLLPLVGGAIVWLMTRF